MTRARKHAAGLLLSLSLFLVPAPGARGGAAESLRLQEARPVGGGSVISEEEWALRLVRELGLSSPLPADPDPAAVFALLCPEKAERGLGRDGSVLPEDGVFRVVVESPEPPQGPIRRVVTVPATALYELTVTGVGRQRWVVDQQPVGHLDPSSLGVAQARQLVPLAEGPHEIAAYLTSDARVTRFELSAHRPLCAAPAGGWRGERGLRQAALARTLVNAFDLESQLPEHEDELQEIEAESFESVAGDGARTERRLGSPASGAAWASALASPAEFTWSFELPEPRVVTIEARTHGVATQLWSVDGRYRIGLAPESVPAGFVWNRIATLALSSGSHAVRALFARGSGVDQLRVRTHRSRDADYVAVLEGLGLPGRAPESPVARVEVERLVRNPAFVSLAAGFRARISGEGTADAGLALSEEPGDPLTSRTLAPALPAEL